MTTANGILDTPALSDILIAGSAAEKKAVTDALFVREKLTAFRQYEVYSAAAPGGDGLTFGTAFQTRQQAVDHIRKNVDAGGFNIQIRCTGAFTDTVLVDGPLLGCPMLVFLGNAGSPSSVTVTRAGGHCFDVRNGATVQVQGFKLSTTTSGNCFQTSNGAFVYALNMDYGACAGSHNNVDDAQMLLSSRTISGGAVSHIHTPNGGLVKDNGNTITIPSAVAFSSYYMGTSDGTTEMVIAPTFTGAGVAGTTGRKAFIHYGGTVRDDTNNRNLLPGDQPVLVQKGGCYGNIERMTRSLTGAVTLSLFDAGVIFLCDAAGGNFTVTLPAAATADGVEFTFKKITSANTVTLDGNASETIDGATTRAISTQWTTVTVHCDGTAWYEV